MTPVDKRPLVPRPGMDDEKAGEKPAATAGFSYLLRLAGQLGATAAVPIASAAVPVVDELADRCRQPRCEGYGLSASCPPYVGGLPAMRRLLDALLPPTIEIELAPAADGACVTISKLRIERIVEAYALAAADPYRAATHNKGIMNGIDAVVIACGNDWRAIEAGAHSYAARSGRYTSLSTWAKDAAGNLVGTLELPLAVGIVGGASRVHPTARVALKILGVKTANELAEVIVSVGLAQNLAAIRALATEGIQRGHMELHARQVAIAAGAEGEMIERVAAQLVAERRIRLDRAQEILSGMCTE